MVGTYKFIKSGYLYSMTLDPSVLGYKWNLWYIYSDVLLCYSCVSIHSFNSLIGYLPFAFIHRYNRNRLCICLVAIHQGNRYRQSWSSCSIRGDRHCSLFTCNCERCCKEDLGLQKEYNCVVCSALGSQDFLRKWRWSLNQPLHKQWIREDRGTFQVRTAKLKLPHENTRGEAKKKCEVGTEEINVHIVVRRKFKTYTEQSEAIVLVQEMQWCTSVFFSFVFFGNESGRKPLKRKMEMVEVRQLNMFYLILTIK